MSVAPVGRRRPAPALDLLPISAALMPLVERAYGYDCHDGDD